MKKYLIPQTRIIVFGGETELLATSLQTSTGEITDENEVLTQKQGSNGNSLWDTWSN